MALKFLTQVLLFSFSELCCCKSSKASVSFNKPAARLDPCCGFIVFAAALPTLQIIRFMHVFAKNGCKGFFRPASSDVYFFIA
jgi:hypothetical protein